MEVRLVHAGRARSLFEKNENYWRGSLVDELEMISIPDNQARLNALLGGELDAMENLDFTLAKANETNEAIQILNAPGINPVPMVMKQISLHFRRYRGTPARALADRQAWSTAHYRGSGRSGTTCSTGACPITTRAATTHVRSRASQVSTSGSWHGGTQGHLDDFGCCTRHARVGDDFCRTGKGRRRRSRD